MTHTTHDLSHSTPADAPMAEVKEQFHRNWGWLVALGALLILGGTAAIFLPVAASLAVTVIVGITMGVCGVLQAIHAFGAKSWKGRGWSGLSALLYIAGAVMLLVNPLAGMVALTAVLIAIIGADGVIRSMIALRIRPEKGWGWLLASGIASVLVAAAMLVFFPGISLTVLGVLAGLTLMFEGWAFLLLGLSVRKAG